MAQKEYFSNNGFLHMSMQDVQAYAMELCSKNDRAGFADMLDGLQEHKEYTKIENMLVHQLLAHDNQGMYSYAFKPDALVNWCQNNTAYAIAYCPSVLNRWLTGASARQEDTMRRIGDALEPTLNAHLMAFLRSEDDLVDTLGFEESTAHRALRRYLADGAHHWRAVSPAWVGPPGSPIRHMACKMGWDEKYLPSMVHRCIGKTNAGQWLQHTPYPYTLMACEEHRLCVQWGELRKEAFASTPQSMACGPGSSALDIAMAKAVLAKVPTAQLTLRRPPRLAPLSKQDEVRAQGVVLAHIGMDSLAEFAVSLARGAHPLGAAQDSFALPASLLDASRNLMP